MLSPQVTPVVQPIKVLVVDDSAVVRGLISRNLAAASGILVAGSAANGELALAELARRDVDIVVLDIDMPVMDGLTALGHIVRNYPHVRVIMASTLTLRRATASRFSRDIATSRPEAGTWLSTAMVQPPSCG